MKTNNQKLMLFVFLTTLLNNSLLNAGILYDAVKTGRLEMVKEVFKEYPNIDVNETNTNTWTSLHLAACVGYSDIVVFLIEQGADINKAAYAGETPLHAASFWNRLSSVKCLVEHGADISLKNARNSLAYDITNIKSIKSYFTYVQNYFDNCVIVTEQTIGADGQPIKPETIPNYELLSVVVKKKSVFQNSLCSNPKIKNDINTHFLYCFPHNMEN